MNGSGFADPFLFGIALCENGRTIGAPISLWEHAAIQ